MWVDGPCKGKGYYQGPGTQHEADDAAFNAVLMPGQQQQQQAVDMGRRWFKTGDAGFLWKVCWWWYWL